MGQFYMPQRFADYDIRYDRVCRHRERQEPPCQKYLAATSTTACVHPTTATSTRSRLTALSAQSSLVGRDYCNDFSLGIEWVQWHRMSDAGHRVLQLE